MKSKLFLAGVISLSTLSFAQVDGALANTVSGRAASLGGATVAAPTSALEAMQGNPAGLAELNGRSLDLSVTSLFSTGSFTNSVSNNGSIRTYAGTLPYGAFAMPLGSGRLKLGILVAPETAMSADWKYIDPPGGLGGTSYGLQQNKSVILTLRSAVGLGYVVNRKVSIGGTVGLVYNSNTLHAPYIFQQQPVIAGLKTLLDLHTHGTGWNGTFGTIITPNNRFKLGLAYKTKTSIESHGDANGNAGAQFATLGAPFRPDFHYDAEVDTKFPQAFSGGISWRAQRYATLSFQGDWINWHDAFDRLPVKLTNGNNADINSFVGSSSMEDEIALQWRNQGVFGFGVESPVGEHLAFRGGYSYATNPVPSGTLTPLTAAILQNTIGTGVGYNRGRYNLDFAYRIQLPASERVEHSSLLAGEYSNSRVDVAVQSLTLTSRFHF
ncbi:MAG TPA: outer membrane protein transport protein [Terriglobales bacterium]|jgi:long-subunit fatty acid transport protein|nr:outer membrane protein transport protein [Terriglobales bacterium]